MKYHMVYTVNQSCSIMNTRYKNHNGFQSISNHECNIRNRISLTLFHNHVESQINKGVCHTNGLAIYIKKYLKAKEEELWKLIYISPCKI
jgi:hypothetical protein